MLKQCSRQVRIRPGSVLVCWCVCVRVCVCVCRCRVSLGSGVVGQAAAKKQPVVLNRDSEAYTLPPRSSSAAQVLDRVTSLEQAAAAAAASGSPRAPAAASGGSSGTSKTADSFTISPLLPPPRTSHSSSGVPTPTGHAGALTISPAAEPAPLREPPSSLLSGDLLDASLMSQLAPVLGDAPVTSVLVQPLLAPDDKVHTHTHTHILTLTHTCRHTRTHTRTRAHTHTS